jgi:CBS domain-containing protein
MIKDVVKVYKQSSVNDVADKMLKNNISHVPVVDSHDRLIGMITDIDLLACMF